MKPSRVELEHVIERKELVALPMRIYSGGL
jgi:hypothetical protein